MSERMSVRIHVGNLEVGGRDAKVNGWRLRLGDRVRGWMVGALEIKRERGGWAVVGGGMHGWMVWEKQRGGESGKCEGGWMVGTKKTGTKRRGRRCQSG